MNGAIVLSAGKGTRMQSDISKQYMLLGDKPLILHTLDAFQKAHRIDEIVLVAGAGDMSHIKLLLENHGYGKICKVTTGGAERQESVFNGLKALSGHCDLVVIHDGARPLVTPEIINASVEQALAYGAATCGMPIKETVKIVGSDGIIKSTPNRAAVWVTQTPQSFRRGIIWKAHENAAANGIIATDDAALVELMGLPVKMFEGSYENIKITTPEDLIMAEGILKARVTNPV